MFTKYFMNKKLYKYFNEMNCSLNWNKKVDNQITSSFIHKLINLKI